MSWGAPGWTPTEVKLSWQGNHTAMCRCAVPQEGGQLHGHTMGQHPVGCFVHSQRKLTKSFASYKQPLAAAGNRSRVSAELEWLFQELDGLSATRSNT